MLCLKLHAVPCLNLVGSRTRRHCHGVLQSMLLCAKQILLLESMPNDGLTNVIGRASSARLVLQ